MEITEVRVVPRNEEKLKAFVTITFDNVFVIRDVKVVQGNKGLIVCMPAKKRNDGTYQDVAHPITQDMRDTITQRILKEYEEALKDFDNIGNRIPPEPKLDDKQPKV
ncbi:MAG: septation regulator SpoVG [Elusimicrobiota bacterium]